VTWFPSGTDLENGHGIKPGIPLNGQFAGKYGEQKHEQPVDLGYQYAPFLDKSTFLDGRRQVLSTKAEVVAGAGHSCIEHLQLVGNFAMKIHVVWVYFGLPAGKPAVNNT